MGSDYNFTKFHIGDQAPNEARDELTNFLDSRCTANGLIQVDHAAEAHFIFLLILGSNGWLHFSSKGHYLPLNTLDYDPVVPDLSNWRDSVTCWVREPDSYVLRRYRETKLVASYANLNDGNRFDSQAAAEMWVPKYEDWAQVLSPDTAEAQFYQLLPAPITDDSPTPTWQSNPADLPANFASLFGWDNQLNKATVNEPVPNGGPGYRSEAGTYEDADYETIVRCYAHPEPNGQYQRHWER